MKMVLNLCYNSRANEISLALLFDGIEYEISDRLESRKTWRTVGFSLMPKTNGFEMKLYIDEEQLGLEIVPPKKLDHGFWRFKMA
ncbi:MAG TPA: hypothetical protein PKC25_13510, partial [Candidatus Rifleibacterium sp.]|nr:hypothetical protein [Candidatus Rifleibacterium sp.]